MANTTNQQGGRQSDDQSRSGQQPGKNQDTERSNMGNQDQGKPGQQDQTGKDQKISRDLESDTDSDRESDIKKDRPGSSSDRSQTDKNKDM